LNTREAQDLGKRIGELVQSGEVRKAYTLLAPVLAERTPFRILGRIGEAIGAESVDKVNGFLDHIAAHKTEGGWVIVGCALGEQLGRDLPGAFARCRNFIIAAGNYSARILRLRAAHPERTLSVAEVEVEGARRSAQDAYTAE
jgi:hypothetical protein